MQLTPGKSYQLNIYSLFYFQVYLVSPKHKMVIRTDEILSILSKLSDESGLKVTVQESVKGGVVAGTACTIGGVLLGPPGLAIGGTVVTTQGLS